MTADTVTICCKLPNGLHLDLYTKGGRIRHTANGSNSSRVIGGYGVTKDIPREHWEEWQKQNAAMKYVKKGLIWSEKDDRRAESKAEEMDELKHGMEPIKVPATGSFSKRADKRIPREVAIAEVE